MTPAELSIQVANTREFIRADPVSLELVPVNLEPTGTGGRRMVDGPALPPQVFRLIPGTDTMPQVQTPDGVQLTPSYVLMGMPDCEMERWARFTLHGLKYQIVSPIRPPHTESAIWKKADVALR